MEFTKVEDIDFKTCDRYSLMDKPKSFFENMSDEQAADILQKHVDMYHNPDDAWSPRNHLGRALEIAVERLRGKR